VRDFCAAAYILPNAVDPNDLVDLNSALENGGKDDLSRNEDIKVNIAAVVVQVLPNGNMATQGRQGPQVPDPRAVGRRRGPA
jgi:flagellar L-ring protein FlgH